VRVSYGRTRSDGLNRYAYVRDVAGEAGISGVSEDPFDWGVPALGFTTFSSLRDRSPSLNVDRRWQLSYGVTKTQGKHTFRAGVEFRDQSLESQTDDNARGNFVFTGLYTRAQDGTRVLPDTGLDFADFLLGLPQQALLQYGPGRVRLLSRSLNGYLQDNWQIRPSLTLNVGLRYEYISPYEEANGHLANLDVTPDFTAAAPVVTGEVGPYTGAFPDGLLYADTNNLAPRIGLAWRWNRRTIVNTGFSIGYNLGAYGSIARRLSGQPPFAVSNTSLGTGTTPLELADPFQSVPPSTTTNSYGVDKDYRLGTVQTWNLNVRRELTRDWNLSLAYTGIRGANLDIQRAPNRDRTGLRIPGVQPFLWQSSEGRSIYHGLTVSVAKRLAHGFSLGANYMFAKSIDNASTLGGGGNTVAQDDRDLDAERGRSAFDRRHRLVANVSWELPFGPKRRWLQTGLGGALAGGWMWNTSVNAESGGPFTAIVRGDVFDVNRGVNGTLRADYTGDDIQLGDPNAERWFNTAAFLVPGPAQFGNAGRNTITGPGSFVVNMGLSRNIPLGRMRSLSLRVQGTNVFNRTQYTSIGTVVNSPTFGQVTGVGAPRSIQIQTQVRF